MHTLNLHGSLYELHEPKIMGILNITPDSFFPGSRTPGDAEIEERVTMMVSEGADMIDVGGYSSHPGASDVTEEEETARLRRGLRIVRKIAPKIPVSVDTFRADVAKMAIEEEGADMVNDISGGALDKKMFRTVARLGVPYILTHMQGTPATMQASPHYANVRTEVTQFLARRIDELSLLGVSDIIADPGFGFGKTIGQNYQLMAHLEDFHQLNRPLLVGISRKSMIYNLLGKTPQDSLNGTTALNTIALLKGAHILRVHDVAQAVDVKNIILALRKSQ